MAARRQLQGPSAGLRGWWRLTIESFVCLILLAAVIAVWSRGPEPWFGGTVTIVLVGLVLRIIWHKG
jgi:hypothetical protein